MSSKRYTKQDCIESIQKAAEQLGHSPTKAEYESLDILPSSGTMKNYFGSWAKAKDAAGLNQCVRNPVQTKNPDILNYSDKEWENLSRQKRYNHKRLAKVAKRKVSKGCKKCGYDDHPAALSFHHKKPENKENTISNMVWDQYPIETINSEIDKCDVYCRNCHQAMESDIYNY